MDDMIAKMLYHSHGGAYTYITEITRYTVNQRVRHVSPTNALRKRPRHKMDHLSCFVPGMLALGAHEGAVTGEKAQLYMDVAINVTYTCHMMYNFTPTGACIRMRHLTPKLHNVLCSQACLPSMSTFGATTR